MPQNGCKCVILNGEIISSVWFVQFCSLSSSKAAKNGRTTLFFGTFSVQELLFLLEMWSTGTKRVVLFGAFC
jgi:hypothetical protein